MWRILARCGSTLAGKLIICIVVPSVKVKLLKRIFASIPAEDIVAISAGRESTTVAAKDVYPALIFTDLTVLWIHFRFASLVVEVVVVAVDLQFLLKLCLLLLARTWIRRETSGDAASCTDTHASVARVSSRGSS